jgi:hypothetical protein
MPKTRKQSRSPKNTTRVKRGGAHRHDISKNLDNAYRNIYDKNGDDNGPPTSYWLDEYLKEIGEKNEHYKKINQINNLLKDGSKMMKKGFDEFEKFMDGDTESDSSSKSSSRYSSKSRYSSDSSSDSSSKSRTRYSSSSSSSSRSRSNSRSKSR